MNRSWFFFVGFCFTTACTPAHQTLSLSAGLSHQYSPAFEPTAIRVSDPNVVAALLIHKQGALSKVHLVPRQAGKASITIRRGFWRSQTLDVDVAAGLPDEDILRRETSGDAERGIVSQLLTLAPGLSRTITTDFEIGSIYQTNSRPFRYLRVSEGATVRKIIFIPDRAGFTDFIVHRADGTAALRFYVIVQASASPRQLASFVEIEKQAGLRVKRISLKVGQNRTLSPGGPFASIYLTAPLVAFTRLGSAAKGSRALRISGREPGSTDLTLYDRNGALLVKYYVDIVPGAPGAKIAAAPRCEALQKGKPVPFYNLIAGDPCPQY